jgi:hypothetical protein
MSQYAGNGVGLEMTRIQSINPVTNRGRGRGTTLWREEGQMAKGNYHHLHAQYVVVR